MPAQIQPITERQRDLITRAHCDTDGLIEPLLDIKGGAKLKLIASLAQRGLIEQMDGQWRLTPAAIAIIKGEAQPEDVLPAVKDAATSPTTLPADDPELEAAVAAAEAGWTREKPDAPENAPAPARTTAEAKPASPRHDSKQALVIGMLKRPEGATIAQLCAATGWQPHTVRGTLAGALKKRLGLVVTSIKPEGGERVYRIA